MLKKDFEYNLEALRGIAALVVVFNHIVFQHLDPDYQLSGVWMFGFPGHLSVLVFFMLSGYVIGLTNKTNLTKSTISLYVKKRLVRIYPIYLISFLFALFISIPQIYPATVFNHLIFAQVITGDVINSNKPLWSLSFEMFYYLLFIPISLFRVNCKYLVVLSFSIAVFSYICPNIISTLAGSFALGFMFWLIGYYLSINVSKMSHSYPLSRLVSSLFLMLCYEDLNTFRTVINKILPHINLTTQNIDFDFFKTPLPLFDLSFLPICVLLILLFTDKKIKNQKYLEYFVYFIPFTGLCYFFYKSSLLNSSALVGCILFLISLVLLLIKPIPFFSKLIKYAFSIGAISYGIYIIHYPLIKLIGQYNNFVGTPFTFVVRSIVVLLVTFIAAYVLEKKFQPMVRSLFFPKKTKPQQVTTE